MQSQSQMVYATQQARVAHTLIGVLNIRDTVLLREPLSTGTVSRSDRLYKDLWM